MCKRRRLEPLGLAGLVLPQTRVLVFDGTFSCHLVLQVSNQLFVVLQNVYVALTRGCHDAIRVDFLVGRVKTEHTQAISAVLTALRLGSVGQNGALFHRQLILVTATLEPSCVANSVFKVNGLLVADVDGFAQLACLGLPVQVQFKFVALLLDPLVQRSLFNLSLHCIDSLRDLLLSLLAVLVGRHDVLHVRLGPEGALRKLQALKAGPDLRAGKSYGSVPHFEHFNHFGAVGTRRSSQTHTARFLLVSKRLFYFQIIGPR